MENNLGNKEIMAKNITRYMQEKGINRADFCRDLGFNYNTVSDWIHARKYPRIDKIEAMAHYFGITTAYLVEPAPPAAQPPTAPYRTPLTERDERDIMISASSLSPVLNEEEREHLRKYRSIDDAGRKIVDGTLDTVYRMRQDDTKPQ